MSSERGQLTFALSARGVDLPSFLAALENYEEDLKLRQEQQQANQSLTAEIDLRLDCEHECCHNLAEAHTALRKRVGDLQSEMQAIRIENKEMMRRFELVLSQLHNPESDMRQPGDESLQNKWLLRKSDLIRAASFSKGSAIYSLMDIVFGKEFLRAFKSYDSLPEDVRKALDKLVGK